MLTKISLKDIEKPKIYKSVNGKCCDEKNAFAIGSKVDFTVEAPRRLGASAVVLRVFTDGGGYTDHPLDFLDITTYETSTYSKPNRKYYEEVLNRNNINPADCIMVGNDLDDDFSDLPDGIDKILITDHLINANNRKIDMKAFKLCEFLEYIKNNY